MIGSAKTATAKNMGIGVAWAQTNGWICQDERDKKNVGVGGVWEQTNRVV